ncbi:hypothetical protein AX17_000067 [Amanita inopinata Kibby_2008]|nr:hypothetical protein AX17_000067 [Amanita inopinata Kibby_2008]
MLPWRIFSRRLTGLPLRHHSADAQIVKRQWQQTRAYQVPSFSARPNSLAAKIWFRKDGTPRSKWKGIAHASLLIFAVYTAYTTLVVISEFGNVNALLHILVLVQRADLEYSSADLSTPQGALSYFRDVCRALDDAGPDELAAFFGSLDIFINSNKYSPEAVVEVHSLLRETCESVHATLRFSRDKDAEVFEVAKDVLKILEKQMNAMLEIILRESKDESSESFAKPLSLGNHLKKGTNDYEVVG